MTVFHVKHLGAKCAHHLALLTSNSALYYSVGAKIERARL